MRFAPRISLSLLLLLITTATLVAQEAKPPGEGALPPGAILRIGSTRLRHASPVQSVAFSPDSQQVASADSEHTVRIWDVASGILVRELPGKSGSVVRWSPKGDVLATGGYYAQRITLFDAKSGERLRELKQNGRSLAFSDDGKRLAAAGNDGIARLWNVADGALVREFKGHTGALFAVAVSHDGRTLASGGGGDGTSPNKNEVRLWNAETGEELAQLEEDEGDLHGLKGWIYDLDFSPDDKTLAVATPYAVRVWNVARKKQLQRLEKSGYAARFAPDENRLLVAANFAIYDALEAEALVKLGDSNFWDEQTRCLDYSPSGALAVTGDEQGRIRVWDARRGEEIVKSTGHRQAITAVAFSPDGTTAASVSRKDGTLRVWGLATGTQLRSIDVEWKGSDVWWNREGYELFFPSYGRDVATWTYNGVWHFHELATREHQKVELGGQEGRESPSGNTIVGGVLSDDGNRAAVVAYGGSRPTVRCYEIDGASLLHDFDPFQDMPGGSDSWISALALSRDGKVLALGLRNRDKAGETIQLWDVEKGKHMRAFRRDENAPGRLVFSRDGTLLASAATGKTPAQVWRVGDGKELHRLNEKDKDRSWYDWSPLAFAPDGKSVATATLAKEIVVWELATGKPAKTFKGHTGIIQALAYSPSGDQLLSGGADATLLLWDVRGEKREEKGKEKELDAAQQMQLWKDLGSVNAGVAGRAAEELAASPRQALGLFRDHLRAVADPELAELPKLIAALDAEDDAARGKARETLRTYGERASKALFLAIKDATPRARVELEGLLAEIDASPTPPAQLQRLRAIGVLERIGGADAVAQLQALIAASPKSTIAGEAQAAIDRLKGRKNTAKTFVAPEE